MTEPEAGDPRLDAEHVRTVTSDDGGDVVVVGVVHDHPASVYRVQRHVERTDPATLALEIPPLAVPLFEDYAEGDRTPPVFGGEMSAAVQAAEAADVVGIDGPSVGFLRRLGTGLYRDGASRATVRSVLKSTAVATRRAVVCRLVATVGASTGVRLEVDSPVDHDVDRTASPDDQATDEATQVRKARAVLDVFEPSRAARFRDDAREAHMVDRLVDLRGRDDVLAVVGIDHLENVAGKLADRLAE